jgi:hypothetical protein
MNLILIIAAAIFAASVYVVYTLGESTESTLPVPGSRPQIFA